MDNRVGDSVPSSAKLQGLLKQLQDVVAELQKFGIVLSKEERQRRLRARRDGETVQRRVYDLATKRGLALPGFPLAGMQNDLELTQSLEPFEATLALGQQLVSDTIMQADTEAWQAFLAYYGVLASLASRDPEVAKELEPVVAFMKTGRRKPEAAPPAPDPNK